MLLTLIISLIITVSAMAVIYNSFNISLSQRSRYLGMLASVGDRAQKRQSVFLEALFLAIPCIPL
ncbi:MAG: FtsX-like permease family protein [Merdibacter sp.]